VVRFTSPRKPTQYLTKFVKEVSKYVKKSSYGLKKTPDLHLEKRRFMRMEFNGLRVVFKPGNLYFLYDKYRLLLHMHRRRKSLEEVPHF